MKNTNRSTKCARRTKADGRRGRRGIDDPLHEVKASGIRGRKAAYLQGRTKKNGVSNVSRSGNDDGISEEGKDR